MVCWHIITCEYPPQVGGVGDYTRLVAEALAEAGEDVHVWCPKLKDEAREFETRDVEEFEACGVKVHRLFETFTPAELKRAGKILDERAGPRRLLVQYVPHGFGYRSMNVAFCLWLWRRAARGDCVEVMVHEPFLAFGEGSLKQDAAAVVHRLMAATLMRASSRVRVSIPAWGEMWRPYGLGRRVPVEWLPVPSTVPVVEDPARTAAVRKSFTTRPDALLLGHFGTYPRHVAEQLKAMLPVVLTRNAPATALLLGRGGETLREEIVRDNPSLASRVWATGALEARELSAHLSACDLVLQPFPDGVTTRRTSVMAALAHGLPVLTTEGRLTEPLWAESRAVALAPVEVESLVKLAQSLMADADERRRLGAAAREFYAERFDLKQTIAALRAGSRNGNGFAA